MKNKFCKLYITVCLQEALLAQALDREPENQRDNYLNFLLI